MELFVDVFVVPVWQNMKGGIMSSPGLPESLWFQMDGCDPWCCEEQAVPSVPAEPYITRTCSVLETEARWKRARNNGKEERVILSQFVLAQQKCKELKAF